MKKTIKKRLKKLLKDLHLYKAASAVNAYRKEFVRAKDICLRYYGKSDLKNTLNMRWARKHGFLYADYRMFHFENKSRAQIRQYIPGGQTGQYIRKLNPDDMEHCMVDKSETYRIYGQYFGREVMVAREATPELRAFLDRHPRCICKPLNGRQGKGIRILENVTAEQVAEEAAGMDGFLLEELIIQHPYMAAVHPQSVNTMRITTLRLKDRVVIIYPMARFGRGSTVVDNAGSGGLLLGVDAETGECMRCAYAEDGGKFTEHPDTGVRFGDLRIPQWREALDFVRELADRIPEIRWTGWDIALTEKGWVLVEANCFGAMIGWQITREKGFRPEMDAYMQEIG